MDEFISTAKGEATVATEEDIALDVHGLTHPDLHRRLTDEEIQNTVIGVWDGVHSFRTVQEYVHDEESTTCEIP